MSSDRLVRIVVNNYPGVGRAIAQVQAFGLNPRSFYLRFEVNEWYNPPLVYTHLARRSSPARAPYYQIVSSKFGLNV